MGILMNATLDHIQKFKSLHWMHWLVVISSLVLTFGAWYVSQYQINERIEARFDSQSKHVVAQITERMQKYEDALWGGVAAINSQSNGINYIEWKRFADTLHIDTKYPGINGIGVIYYVLPERLNAYLAKKRSLRPDYNIHPEHDKNEYWPITYIEPVASNAKAIGLDMAFEKNRFEAAKKARDTGKAQITAPIVLVQDAKKTPGFLFYAPFYEGNTIPATLEERQEKFIGMVYEPFITYRLMEGMLKKEHRLVNIRLRDGDEVIFDEFSQDLEDLDPNPLFEHTVEVTMYGRPWKVDIRSAQSFRTLVHNNQPIIILVGGLLVDAMLLWVFLLLTRSNKLATDLANNMTKRVREEAARVIAITDTVLDGLITINGRGNIQTFNPAASQIFGYTPEEVIGKNVSMLMPEPYHSEHDGYLHNYQSTGEKKIIGTVREVSGKRKCGSIFPMELSVNEMQTEDERMFVGTARDITERKMADDYQQRLVDKLMKSNTDLERFAYIASHDMQEPIRMVTNFSDIIAKDYVDVLDDTGKEYLKLVVNAGIRMRDLVDDLLAYSRVGNESMQMIVFDGENTLTGVRENLHELLEEQKVELTHSSLPTFYGNPVQIMRLLQNLIINGIKYQPEGNIPKIHISAEETSAYWRISVQDNGLGIKPEFIEAIFQPFRRLHTWDAICGTGLGLSICKKIVENHGGKIEVTSELGKGSIFSFSISKKLSEKSQRTENNA